MPVDPEEFVDRVCVRIGELRRARGITQEDMAARLGTIVSNYRRIEGGQNLTLTKVAEIANALELEHPGELLVDPSEGRPKRGHSKLSPKPATNAKPRRKV